MKRALYCIVHCININYLDAIQASLLPEKLNRFHLRNELLSINSLGIYNI